MGPNIGFRRVEHRSRRGQICLLESSGLLLGACWAPGGQQDRFGAALWGALGMRPLPALDAKAAFEIRNIAPDAEYREELNRGLKGSPDHH